MLDTLTKEFFESRLGQTFQIGLSSGETLDLVVVRVEEARAGGLASARRTPFSVLFRGGPRDRHLPQRIYELRHGELGVLPLFLVPVGPDEAGMCYEAVFT